MSQWIPLSHAILGSVIEYLPSPIVAQRERIDKILDETIYSAVDSELDKSKLVDPSFVKAMQECDSSHPETHTIAYVSKLLSIPNEDLPKASNASSGGLTADEIQERGRIARELAKRHLKQLLWHKKLQNEDEFVIKPKKIHLNGNLRRTILRMRKMRAMQT